MLFRSADHHRTRVETSIRVDDSTEDAIVQACEQGKHDLMVMGVSRRPGDTLSFGDVAGGLLKRAKCSLVLVAPQARPAVKSSAKTEPAAAAVG